VSENCYGLGWAAAFLTGRWLVLRWAPKYDLPRDRVEEALVWILLGALIGARLYYVAQNEPIFYVTHPRHIVAMWEGGHAFFGGLFGAVGAAYLYARRARLRFGPLADLFGPAIPIAAAVGRVACGLDGMDYGTPSNLPWSVLYLNANSYAPIDGVARHPDQYYELVGDLLIAMILLKLRRRVVLSDGALFLTYLVLFSLLRFFLFFVRGSVQPVALGLKNVQWTALALLAITVPMLLTLSRRRLARWPAFDASVETEAHNGLWVR
jgi:phosphatidylglycerol:prolipoprotein diacylglycerol transferase